MINNFQSNKVKDFFNNYLEHRDLADGTVPSLERVPGSG